METCIAIFCACVVPTAPLYTALERKLGLRRSKMAGWVYKPPTHGPRRPGHRLDSIDEDRKKLQNSNNAAMDSAGVHTAFSDATASQWEGVTSKVTTSYRSETAENIPMNAIDVERGLEWTSERI